MTTASQQADQYETDANEGLDTLHYDQSESDQMTVAVAQVHALLAISARLDPLDTTMGEGR
jgi:hypothetical protein